MIRGDSIVQLLNVVDARGSREEAIRQLERFLPKMDLENRTIKRRLYQVLPALLAHFVMRKEKVKMLHFIRLILAYEHEEPYRNLMKRWFSFIVKATVTFSPVADEFGSLIAYDQIEFFMNMCHFLKSQKKLHKYIYFFANLTYIEFLSINATNVALFEEKMGLLPITNGARGAIISMAQELDSRVTMLRGYAQGPIEDFNEVHKYVSDTMMTPIRRADLQMCAKEEEITFLLVACLRQMSLVASDAGENEKVRQLLAQAVEMNYVFNNEQRLVLKNIRRQANFRNRVNSQRPRRQTSIRVIVTSEPQPIEVLRMFDDEEIQAGYERSVSFLERILYDE